MKAGASDKEQQHLSLVLLPLLLLPVVRLVGLRSRIFTVSVSQLKPWAWSLRFAFMSAPVAAVACGDEGRRGFTQHCNVAVHCNSRVRLVLVV